MKRIKFGNNSNREISNHKLIDKINTACHRVLIASTGNRRNGLVEYHTPYSSKATTETSKKNSTRDPPHINQLKCSVVGLFRDILCFCLTFIHHNNKCVL